MPLQLRELSRILLASSPLLAPGIDRDVPSVQTTDPTEIVIIGTVHGDHQSNDQYSQEDLRDIIVALQPAAILVELPPSINGKPTVVDGRRASWLSAANEGWAQNEAATVLGVPLIPYDREGRNEYYARTRYFARRDSSAARLTELIDRLRGADGTALEAQLLDTYRHIARSQRLLQQQAPPDVVNSEAFDHLVRAKRLIDQELVLHLVDSYPEQAELVEEYRFFRAEWAERNRIMTENIQRIADRFERQRVVVLTGSEHRYILKENLMKVEGVAVREYWELIDLNAR